MKILLFSCLLLPMCLCAQKSFSDLNEKIIDVLIYDSLEELPQDSLEIQLLSAIIHQQHAPARSAEFIISAKGEIIFNGRIDYKPYLSLVEGYFYLYEDPQRAEQLLLQALADFEENGNKQMNYVSQYLLLRILIVSDRWKLAYESYQRFNDFVSKNFSDDFEGQKIKLLGEHLYGTILTGASSLDTTYHAEAKKHLSQLIEKAEKLNADPVLYNAIGNLAFIHFVDGEYYKMIPLALEDLAYSKANNKIESICGLNITLSSAFYAINDLEKAEYHFEEAEKLIPQATRLFTIQEFLKNAQNFYKQGDSEKVFRLLDIFRNVFVSKSNITAGVNYEYLKAETKLQEAEKQIEYLKERNKLTTRNNWLLGLLLFAIFLLFIIFYRLHKSQVNFRKKLEAINENLEAEVKNRTKKVYEQNQKIKQFSYRNSHMTRAPVARLIGLAELLLDDPESNKELLKEIKASSIEVDNIIRDINEVLSDDNHK